MFAAPKDDVRVLLEPDPAATLAATGVDWDSLAAAAAAARERARERHAAALAQRPRLDASVDWRNNAGQGIVIETTVSGAARYAAYYGALSPWAADAGAMSRLDVLGSSAVLPLVAVAHGARARGARSRRHDPGLPRARARRAAAISMNAALFRKELRDLLPWGILGLALGLSSFAELLLEQVDLAPLGQTFYLLNEYNVVVYWLIAFAIGTGLVIREHDDRTLAFLDGLPVSRSRVFFVKCVVMSALVMVGPLLEVVALATLHLLSRGSLDRELHGLLLLQGLGMQALLLVNGLMLGAAFGRLRSLAWAAAGLAAAAFVLFAQRVPRAALLNPLTLLDWEWTSAGLLVDGETVRTQLAVTVLAALIAWHGFVRAGKARRQLSFTGPIAGAAVVAATAAIGVAVFVIVMRPLDETVTEPRAKRSRLPVCAEPARADPDTPLSHLLSGARGASSSRAGR